MSNNWKIRAVNDDGEPTDESDIRLVGTATNSEGGGAFEDTDGDDVAELQNDHADMQGGDLRNAGTVNPEKQSISDSLDIVRQRGLPRRDPRPHSPSGLASRDYQPATGIERVESFAVNPSAEGDITVDHTSFTMEWNIKLPQPITQAEGYGPAYASFSGNATDIASGEELQLQLRLGDLHQEKPYITTHRLTQDSQFHSAMIEIAPDVQAGQVNDHIRRILLHTRVTGGSATLKNGLTVNIWRER